MSIPAPRADAEQADPVPGSDPWAAIRRGAHLLFKAWITPQRLCGCKRTRAR